MSYYLLGGKCNVATAIIFLIDVTHPKTRHVLLIEGIVIGDLMKNK